MKCRERLDVKCLHTPVHANHAPAPRASCPQVRRGISENVQFDDATKTAVVDAPKTNDKTPNSVRPHPHTHFYKPGAPWVPRSHAAPKECRSPPSPSCFRACSIFAILNVTFCCPTVSCVRAI
ncbi:unnamed protein product [Periconia digitata]|uniref:Uncharacterized protein n=1 Tax=Periconia digitata TaxID=1303443 RepID=A0A9W4XRN2_9PLEO|nr:unnamed protein product [Periconia digitata]